MSRLGIPNSELDQQSYCIFRAQSLYTDVLYSGQALPGHFMQLLDPVVGAYLPGTHRLHDFSSMAPDNIPYFPLAHCSHTLRHLSAYLPLVHVCRVRDAVILLLNPGWQVLVNKDEIEIIHSQSLADTHTFPLHHHKDTHRNWAGSPTVDLAELLKKIF